jgi:hypothetical protein
VPREAPLVRSRWLPSEWIPFIETTSGALLGWRFVWELRGDSGNHAAWENARVSTVLYGAGTSHSPLVFACGLSAPGWNHNYVRYCAVRGTRQPLLPVKFRLTDFDRSGHSDHMRSGLKRSRRASWSTSGVIAKYTMSFTRKAGRIAERRIVTIESPPVREFVQVLLGEPIRNFVSEPLINERSTRAATA